MNNYFVLLMCFSTQGWTWFAFNARIFFNTAWSCWIAKVNRRMLCGLFNMAGFLIIITQNSEFSKIDRADINPNIPVFIASAWSRLWSSKAGFDTPLLELFRRGEDKPRASIFDIARLNWVRVSFYFSVFNLKSQNMKLISQNALSARASFKCLAILIIR